MKAEVEAYNAEKQRMKSIEVSDAMYIYLYIYTSMLAGRK